jgi:broad specificity phosphatase PhoE
MTAMVDAGAAPLPQAWLVRHGETTWTITGQHTGRTDIALTQRGRDEARHLRERLHRLDFSEVLTSPLERSRQTSELAGFDARPDPDLMEWDYGSYEGRRTSEIHAERPGWQLFEDGCPGGETLSAVAARADRVIDRVRDVHHRGGNVLLFAHRDILRVLTVRWLDIAARAGRLLYLQPGSVSILGYDHSLREPVIRLWNDVPD